MDTITYRNITIHVEKINSVRSFSMPSCHFSRVYEKTTWSDLKAASGQQVKNNCKKLEYAEIATITVEQAEFKLICSDVSYPRDCYRKYTPQSCAASDGKWKCIVIKERKSGQQIILYTAGRIYPLYAAICE